VYPRPNHAPLWAITPLRREQLKRLNAPGANAEATLAAELYLEEGCDSLVDLGCWLGVLGLKLKQLLNPKRLYLLDALPLYLFIAQMLFTEQEALADVTFQEMYVLPDDAHQPRYFTVDFGNSIRTSTSLKLSYDSTRVLALIPVGETVTTAEAIVKLRELCGAAGYLKIDIDGVDYALVNELLQTDFRPKVLHFEGLKHNPDFEYQLFETLESLRRAGYLVPTTELIFEESRDMVCLMTSKNGWRLLSYKKNAELIMTFDHVLTSRTP